LKRELQEHFAGFYNKLITEKRGYGEIAEGLYFN
jgi:hypothetical protein